MRCLPSMVHGRQLCFTGKPRPDVQFWPNESSGGVIGSADVSIARARRRYKWRRYSLSKHLDNDVISDSRRPPRPPKIKKA